MLQLRCRWPPLNTVCSVHYSNALCGQLSSDSVSCSIVFSFSSFCSPADCSGHICLSNASSAQFKVQWIRCAVAVFMMVLPLV